MRGNRIETYKIINGIIEFLIVVDIFFNISPRTWKFLSRHIWKTKTTSQLDFLFYFILFYLFIYLSIYLYFIYLFIFLIEKYILNTNCLIK